MNLVKNHKTWYTLTGICLILQSFIADHCSVSPMDIVNLIETVAPAIFAVVAVVLHGKSKQIQQVAQVAEEVANESK